MTKREERDLQDARIFASLWALAHFDTDDPTAENIADGAGVEGTKVFYTPQQATASLKRLAKKGLTFEEEERIKSGRHNQRAYNLTTLGFGIGTAVEAACSDNS